MEKSGLSLQNEIKKQVKYDIFDKHHPLRRVRSPWIETATE